MNLCEYQMSRSFIDLGPRSLRFNIFKFLFLRNCMADWNQILCGASMGSGNESLVKDLGHMTKMADMPIYGKNLKNIFSGTKRTMTLKVGMLHWVLEYYQVCSNDVCGMTLTYFTAMSNWSMLLCGEKGKTMDFFRKCCSIWNKSW